MTHVKNTTSKYDPACYEWLSSPEGTLALEQTLSEAQEWVDRFSAQVRVEADVWRQPMTL